MSLCFPQSHILLHIVRSASLVLTAGDSESSSLEGITLTDIGCLTHAWPRVAHLHALALLLTTLGELFSYYSHFKGDETEAQREVTWHCHEA